MLKKTTAFKLLILLLVTSPMYSADQRVRQVVNQFNEQLQQDGIAGQFQVNNGVITFTGNNPPGWAVDEQLKTLGITPRFGTGGVNPFKFYTHEEYRVTSLYGYAMLRGLSDLWLERDGGNGNRLGLNLIGDVAGYLGSSLFEDLHNHQNRVEERNDFWNNVREQIIPTLLNYAKQPQIIGIICGLVLLFIGLPLIIWHGSKAFFKWIFVRRPTILGAKDSDIYGGLFHRLFFKYPKLPKVIVNKALERQLDSLIAMNQLVTSKNKGDYFSDPEKTPYQHIMAYGVAGVGKTLFAKKLAQESNMHFMYLTVSDLSQLPEEEALEELKNFFAYARKFAPCVLIIDEADRLFAGEDVKAKKLKTLFQKEFSKAVDENIQLVLITNYPWVFPDPIINRISRVLSFDTPTYDTQIKLFVEHLKIALNKQNKPLLKKKELQEYLSKDLLEGLVGRDIEAISVAFSLQEIQTLITLVREIEMYKQGKADMKSFKAAQLQQETPITTTIETKPPQKQINNRFYR